MRDSTAGRGAGLPALLTGAMAVSMLQLFLLGALGPRIVQDLGIGTATLGLTTTIGFGVAAVLSPLGGQVVDRIGPRRSIVLLLLVAAGVLVLIGAAPGPVLLLVAVGLGGVPQALANPATNKAILAVVPAERRGAITGLKQSGVQLGAFVAGLPLALLAGAVGWRAAVWTAAGLAAVAGVSALRILPADHAGPRPRQSFLLRPRGTVAWLAAFSLFLGCGIASVNTYLALFGVERVGFGRTTAAALVAVLGVAGIVGRIGWSRVATGQRGKWLPAVLAGGAVLAGLLLAAAADAPALVWCAAVLVGVFAVSANAVSMVLVMQRSTGRAGQESALVAAGFFAGFAVGPPLFGVLAQSGRYDVAWLLVAAEFAVAALIATRWALRD